MTFHRRLSVIIILAVTAGVAAMTLLTSGATGSPDAPDPPTLGEDFDPPPPPHPSEHHQVELGDSKIVEDVELVYRDGYVYEIPIKLKVEIVEFEDGARATRYSELDGDDYFEAELQRQIEAGEGYPAESIEQFTRQRQDRDD